MLYLHKDNEIFNAKHNLIKCAEVNSLLECKDKFETDASIKSNYDFSELMHFP